MMNSKDMEDEMEKVFIFDTTLRDGTQMEGLTLTVDDKLKIAKKLDELGVDYIEGGFPLSNAKDREFFERVRRMRLKNATVVAFGATRHKDADVAKDAGLLSLISAKTKAVCIHGKSFDVHVVETLNTTLENNLVMIEQSVGFLKAHKKEVIYDAEHFFDAYKSDAKYALSTLSAALIGGADWLVLCDTNGGTLPSEISAILKKVKAKLGPKASARLGIHAHNDSDCAVANSVTAVQEGCRQVQGTINGYGERAGNANLVSIIAALRLKAGYDCIGKDGLRKLTDASHYIAEVVNQAPNIHQPYVGQSAFAHKGGTHVSAMARKKNAYEHIDPAEVGNESRVLISELSGRSSIELKAKEMGLKIDKNSELAGKILKRVEELEGSGYHFEAAEGSFEVLVKKAAGGYEPFFRLESYRVLVERDAGGELLSEATVKVHVRGRRVIQTAEGNGPVNALDKAIRKAISRAYPVVKGMHLSDYKVRVLNENTGTSARVRVLIETSDGENSWGTVGVHENIIEASWEALLDSLDFGLIRAKDE